jgi:FixJ family two-component response regulator
MNDETSMVFVIDDDAAIREALEDLLRSIGLGMMGFVHPQEFMAATKPDAPSCMILDVRLPGMSGLEFQRELNTAQSKIPIIFITGHGDIPMSVRAMKAGACEFLTKPFRHQDLIEAVQQAIESDHERRREERATAELQRRFETLTTREREVMAVLVTGQLNKQIGIAIGATESTVKAHRTQIMRKMQASSLAELVRMADKLQIQTATVAEFAAA